ncbi:MAG: hypothetical protein A3F70_10625 [Acidobacteria bacterium RIFCSPLOWO2_12_FULL_67_14]|nr:MAG: hypothetical protein A3H29_09550 [Acidobacteria bacterium RIFCSPLOWO2_02_FULL_67_21]OFW35155.1 MAG: hypothetical protein A3F70_10625 [Acidobacteria bacterium RIFCSPLOWO2_12_FULL_67_14]
MEAASQEVVMSAQLALYDMPERRVRQTPWPPPGREGADRRSQPHVVMCASCRAREARYGFRSHYDDDPTLERPRTLCFLCFRAEVSRRQEAARAVQARLPLEQTLEALGRRRRRAQIKARRALGL